ncbi:MAG: amidohydrolase family protein [Acidimicrobiales bacterium]|jgi:cytosine/adenosine deaminase-related metal-dependent hydrolase
MSTSEDSGALRAMEPGVTPGMVCGHHHLYSTLARGMPAPPRVARNFQEILELVWWRLDCALDLEMIKWSAMLGALEALERGTTAIVDHHASPNAIEGSLSVISDACAEVGVRTSCCYEVTDRNGPEGMRAGLEENERFLRAGGRGFVGAHACFTLSPASLEAVAGLASELGVGVHIHVAEDRIDSAAGGRLEGVAGDAWLLAHCVHLDRPLRGTIAHNPRSNMNNAVGYARPVRHKNTVVLGTDGIGGDMLEEFRIAYVRHREDDVTAAPDSAWSWLENGRALVPEAAGDRVVWSYEPIDPWYLAFTPGVCPVEVTVGGEVVLKDGRPTKVDPVEVRAKAHEQALRLWARL